MVLNEREERKGEMKEKTRGKTTGKLNLKTEVAKRGNDVHVSDFPEIGRVFVTAEK